jgi:WD40 repeat protein
MSTACFRRFISLATLSALVACGSDSDRVPSAPSPSLTGNPTTARWSPWSEPVNLGPAINSPFLEESPMLSNDGLTLYFMSTRSGGVGGNDLWASHRECEGCPWQDAVNLVAVNSSRNENGPSLSRDGHLLFFQSNRPGSQLLDVFMTSRANKHDDHGWEPAVRLGPDVNTGLRDIYPRYLPIGPDDAASLYFSRGATTHDADLFVVAITRDGTTLAPAQALAELNDPDPVIDDNMPSVRTDGREIYFRSTRAGSLGGGDLWVSTRPSADAAWLPPANPGEPVNTGFDEVTPSLSFDGRSLFFVSDRPGGVGGYDIWMSTRTVSSAVDDAIEVLAVPNSISLDLATENAPQYTDWSAPINLGPVVNSSVGDLEVAISRDGLSLYVASTRPGGAGDFDIWVCQRAEVGDAWGPPQNLGPSINTPAREQAPFLSPDGHRLYFFSDRPGGFGGTDLYVSRRHDKRDDFGWQPPENLGSGVNGLFNETLPMLLDDAASGAVTLYFGSNRPGMGGTDIYVSILQPDESFGPAALVAELSTPFRDADAAIRRDGLEMLIASDRPGTLGAFDLWVTTRASAADAWSTPVNLGPGINGASDDSRGALSFDGTTLYMESNRPGSVGGHDLWVTTRSKLKPND